MSIASLATGCPRSVISGRASLRHHSWSQPKCLICLELRDLAKNRRLLRQSSGRRQGRARHRAEEHHQDVRRQLVIDLARELVAASAGKREDLARLKAEMLKIGNSGDIEAIIKHATAIKQFQLGMLVSDTVQLRH